MTASQYHFFTEQSAAVVAVDSTGDKLTFTPSQPIEVVGFGLTVTVALATAALVFAVDKRPNLGSDTDRVEINEATAGEAGAVGRVYYRPIDNAGVGNYKVLMGEQVVWEVKAASGGAGDGYAFIRYRALPIQPKENESGIGDAKNVKFLTA